VEYSTKLGFSSVSVHYYDTGSTSQFSSVPPVKTTMIPSSSMTMMFMVIILSLFVIQGTSSFILYPQKASFLRLLSSEVGDDSDVTADADEPVFAQSTVRIDDGGSNMTDRFKYSVNALMGTYDPQVGVDDERQAGNILNAMLNFPTEFMFNAVGRTNGDDSLKEEYAEQVKKIVTSLSGDDDHFQCQVTPRGKSFTRVSIQVQVDSAAVINSIYNELDKIEMTVFKY
jgi:putative lipoic acid-binding regulatory protein